MKILSIDHGTKRIGLAVSDELGISTKALPTLTVKSDEHAVNLVLETLVNEGCGKILIGMPTGPGGSDSSQTTLVKDFVQKLKEKTSLEIIFWDETYSSKEASKNIKGKKKNNLDSEAARILLQEYLNSL